MLVDSTSFSENSKVWLYPSSRKFYPTEIEGLTSKIEVFLTSWTQDSEPIPTFFQIQYNRFIVIFTPEDFSLKTASIDALVGFILGLQQTYEVELLDRMNVCFKQGEHVQYKDLKTFKTLIKDKSVNKDTIVFDNLIQTKEEFENYWEMPASDSWYGNMFK